MNTLNYNRIQFLKSVAKMSGLPKDMGSEVAFAGRSNAGKSSAINAITRIARLARTSKTPGRTQLINFFEMDSERRLVDLPGYGFAKVPPEIKQQWERLVTDYLTLRESLKGIILLMDIRHPLSPLDRQMIKWGVNQDRPLHILLTKADKLKRGAQQNSYLYVKKELSGYEGYVTVQLFSAMTLAGCDEAREKITEWLLSD